MLNREDREAIEGLFERIENIARTSPSRDAEAEDLIKDRLRHAPAAPYYMAQTILVQEHALSLAQRKIEELEAELVRRQAHTGLPDDDYSRSRHAGAGPWGRRDGYDNRADRGGGFLAGAAQTALGVTGGVLLGSAIASMFGGDAHAQEVSQADQPIDDQDQDADMGDDDGDFDMGGDF